MRTAGTKRGTVVSMTKRTLRLPTLGSLLPYRWWWRPGRERDAVFYDRQVRARLKRIAPRSYAKSPYYFLWAIIVDRLRRDGFGRVLEIGCGPGQLAEFLFDQGMQHYVGVDFSASALEHARHLAPRGTFVHADARTTTVHTDYPHDVIICTEVLEHVEGDLDVIARFTPGKRCLCSVPNFEFESHVRYFRDTAEVEARYRRLFDAFDVIALQSANHAGDQFFLFEGVRNEHVPEA